MRFNDQNTATLTNLLNALGQGLDASTGYSILQQTVGDQQAQMQQRKDRMQQMAGTVAEGATQGLPYGAASSLLDLLTPRPGIPNQMQGMLDTAYPQGNAPMNYQGQQMDLPQGSRPSGYGDQAQSPLYTQNPGVQMDMALQQAQLASAMAPPEPTAGQLEDQKFSTLVSALQNLLGPGSQMSPEEVMAGVMSDPDYAGVFAQNYAKLIPLFPQLQPSL